MPLAPGTSLLTRLEKAYADPIACRSDSVPIYKITGDDLREVITILKATLSATPGLTEDSDVKWLREKCILAGKGTLNNIDARAVLRIIDRLSTPGTARTALDPRVDVGKMTESSGKVTWCVTLYRAGDTMLDGFSVYSSQSEGRARHTAEEYKHFFGQAPKPDILAFDCDLPEATPGAADVDLEAATEDAIAINQMADVIEKWLRRRAPVSVGESSLKYAVTQIDLARAVLESLSKLRQAGSGISAGLRERKEGVES